MLIEISVNGIEPVISLGRDNIAVATTNEHIPAATALATGLYGVKTNQVPVCRGHHTLILPNINVRVERKPGHAARNGLHEHQAGRVSINSGVSALNPWTNDNIAEQGLLFPGKERNLMSNHAAARDRQITAAIAYIEKSIAVSGELKEQKMNIARKIIEAQMFNLLLHRHWRKTRVTCWCGLFSRILI